MQDSSSVLGIEDLAQLSRKKYSILDKELKGNAELPRVAHGQLLISGDFCRTWEEAHSSYSRTPTVLTAIRPLVVQGHSVKEFNIDRRDGRWLDLLCSP